MVPSFDAAIRSNGFLDLVLNSSDHRAGRELSLLDHGANSRRSGTANVQ